MKDIEDIHLEAMHYASEADLVKKSNINLFNELTKLALEKEKEAASRVPLDVEPTRSILFRSAACLALDLKEFREAEKLINTAMAGNPPPEILDELRDLIEVVNFNRHLDVKGIELYDNELQLSISGRGVSFGITKTKDFTDRVLTLERIVKRTIHRKLGYSFEENARDPKGRKEAYETYISTPRAASFAVTVSLGLPERSPLLIKSNTEKEDIIEEIISCLECLETGEYNLLKDKIPDPAYLRNFIGLAKKIAPDGKRIEQVGFTAKCNGKEKRLGFRIQTNEFKNISEKLLTSNNEVKPEKMSISGTLSYADAVGKVNKIKIVNSVSSEEFIVPEGMMNDIVRPHWECNVTVTGIKNDQGKYELDTIESDEEG